MAIVHNRGRGPVPTFEGMVKWFARAALALTLLFVGTPAVAAFPHQYLPQPTGPNPIGRETIHLVDESRTDPWVPQAGARELMVSLFYPARSSGAKAPYLSTTEARLFLESRGLNQAGLAERLAGTRSSARLGAKPASGRYPLVILSPGFGVHRHTLTHLAEDLASRGYLVAAVDHAYESAGTEFPGGRVLTCVACQSGEPVKVAEERAKDISFLVDWMLENQPRIDPSRIGVAGHSIGGSAAGSAMVADPRLRAGVNIDGSFDGGFHSPLPDSGIGGRPFLLLGSDQAHSSGQPTWERDWPKLDGWKRWLYVTGTTHIGLSDISVLADQSGLTDPVFSLPGLRIAEIMRAYVGAFFDLHLRGVPQPLLDGPTPANPEVVFKEVA